MSISLKEDKNIIDLQLLTSCLLVAIYLDFIFYTLHVVSTNNCQKSCSGDSENKQQLFTLSVFDNEWDEFKFVLSSGFAIDLANAMLDILKFDVCICVLHMQNYFMINYIFPNEILQITRVTFKSNFEI